MTQQLCLQDKSMAFLFSGETLWLSHKCMAELFGVGVTAISKQLNNKDKDA